MIENQEIMQDNKCDIPLVTIRCITYNHEPYIRQCLEGFVMQQTNFKFEAIVHDDASTDGTAAIVAEFAEKYPDIIKPIYQKENQYSKRDGSIRRIMDAHTHGKYIAMCEGDDYWTDPLKLQKQVDFLEANPEYSMCFHYAEVKYVDDINSSFVYTPLEDREYSAREIYEKWIIPTASVVYRTEYQPKSTPKWVVFGDIFLFLSLAQKGKLFGMNFTGSVYRRHADSLMQLVKRDPSNTVKLYTQYSKMRDSFPEYKSISEWYMAHYFDALYNVPYFYGVTKFRFMYLMRKPRKIFSRYFLRTIYFAFKDLIYMFK